MSYVEMRLRFYSVHFCFLAGFHAVSCYLAHIIRLLQYNFPNHNKSNGINRPQVTKFSILALKQMKQ